MITMRKIKQGPPNTVLQTFKYERLKIYSLGQNPVFKVKRKLRSKSFRNPSNILMVSARERERTDDLYLLAKENQDKHSRSRL